MLRARQASVEVPGEAIDRSRTEDRGSYGGGRMSRGSRTLRSDSRYLPQRCMDEVAEDQFTRMAQGRRFVSAVQSERSDPVPQPQVADEEAVNRVSAVHSEISDTAPQPEVADEEAVNRGDETDGDATLVANGHVTPVVSGGATPTA